MALGIIRRTPQVLVALGAFFCIIGGAFLAAGFLASTATSVYAQQVASFNKAVAVYEGGGDDAGLRVVKGEAMRRRLSMASSSSSSASVVARSSSSFSSFPSAFSSSPSVPTRHMISELLPVIMNNTLPAATSPTNNSIVIVGAHEGVTHYPLNTSIIAVGVPTSVHDFAVDNGTISFDFPFVAKSTSAGGGDESLGSDAADGDEVAEIIVQNFTRDDVMLRRHAIAQAICDNPDGDEACPASYFQNTYCKLHYGNASTYIGTGCLRGQQSCGVCAYHGHLETYCVPMTFTMRKGPSVYNNSNIVTQKVWGPDPSLPSCYFPFHDTNDQLYTHEDFEVTNIKVVLALSTDPSIVLQKLTMGTNVFAHYNPHERSSLFGGDRDTSHDALIITGCVMGALGLVTLGVGLVLWYRRAQRRELRNPLRYSIIAGVNANNVNGNANANDDDYGSHAKSGKPNYGSVTTAAGGGSGNKGYCPSTASGNTGGGAENNVDGHANNGYNANQASVLSEALV